MRKQQRNRHMGKYTIKKQKKREKIFKSTVNASNLTGNRRLTSISLGTLIILIVAVILVSKILAYFIDQKTKTNEFTIGRVSINLTQPAWEALPDSDHDGIPNDAEDLQPSQTIAKDPRVTNSGSSPAFIYMTVKIPKGKWKVSDTINYELFNYTVNIGWTEMEHYYNSQNDYIERTYYYSGTGGVLAPGASTPSLFNSIKFANVESGTVEGVAERIVINAYGIQSSSLPSGSDTVTTAVNLLGWTAKVATAPKKLADVVNVGDYVNYDASSGAEAIYTTDSNITGSSTASTYSSSDPMAWRVLSKNSETGEVTLVAADTTANTLTLRGATGYINAEAIINDIGAVYGHGKGATSGKSITIEDINALIGYTVTGSKITKTYSSGNNSYPSELPSGIAVSGSTITAEPEKLYYNYLGSSYISEGTLIHNMLFKKDTDTATNKSNYWVDSRCVSLYDNYCDFRVHTVSEGRVYSGILYGSRGNANDSSNAVVPTVSLHSNIQTTGQNGERSMANNYRIKKKRNSVEY